MATTFNFADAFVNASEMGQSFNIVGTVTDAIADGQLTYLTRNLMRKDKRIVFTVNRKIDGKDKVIKLFCSQNVSNDIRAGRIKMGDVLDLPIDLNEENGRFTIILPEESATVVDLKKVTKSTAPKTKLTFDQIIAEL